MSEAAIDKLLDIMAALRDPHSGCAWDRKQTLESLAPYTQEEAAEVVEAIASGDRDNLKEELGDLLLQVVFQSQIARENGWFEFADVVDAISNKMLRRHPHVFADQATTDVATIKQSWEAIKAAERAQKGEHRASLLDGIPASLPALARAAKIQKQAAKVGFDWSEAEPVMAQVVAELDELREAYAAENEQAIGDELGDVLFTVVNLARKLNLDPELALRRASGKFEQRFRRMEELGQLSDLDSAALEALWQQAKEDLAGRE